ncbi:DUF4126 domain-containing protein [Lacisediminimonas profundi]|uniref:DUF4126 domain-containing protein n=1 Tax=Lacisediminimonas profundi TaxID=2603856 RepID=UPI00124BC855|nr:DUF4126 domain-containing protein [Lacisediminimonas profundi]
MAELFPAAAMAAGLSWASGIRLYMTLFVAGWLGRQGWITLPEGLQVLESSWVLAVTGGLFAVEFLADKVPGVDSVWDAIQTFIRIPAGAVLGAAALGQADPALTAIAALLGGTFAAGAHATKAGSRALINTSPEPFSNWAASFSEEAVVVAGLWAAFFHPWVLVVILVLFTLLAFWLLPKVWRGLRWLFRRMAA